MLNVATSKRAKAAPSGKAKRLAEDWKTLDDATQRGVRFDGDNRGAGRGEANAESRGFTGTYMTRDPRDDRTDIRNQLASLARPMALTDEEVNAVQDKMIKDAEMNFDDWFSTVWDFESDNPTMQRWAQEINPEYFKRREDEIDNKAEIQKRIAKLKLYGPRSDQDIRLMFAISTGGLNTEYINTPLHAGTAAGGGLGSGAHYQRGLWSPMQAITGFNIRGNTTASDPANHALQRRERYPMGDLGQLRWDRNYRAANEWISPQVGQIGPQGQGRNRRGKETMGFAPRI